MSQSNRSKVTIWTAVTALLFVLSQDFWSWADGVSPVGPFGVPRWVYVFALLQFGLAAGIYWFGRRHWGVEDDGNPDARAESTSHTDDGGTP